MRGVMKKYFLHNKKGVSLLEGLIALLLLALIATGTFGVLLSTSRRSTQPDIREEMVLAVERAMDKLQVYVYPNSYAYGSLPYDVKGGLCGDYNPLGDNTHNIECMLPPICNRNQSHFTYKVSKISETEWPKGKLRLTDLGSGVDYQLRAPYTVQFDIQCNGFRL